MSVLTTSEVCVPADAEGNFVLNSNGQLVQIRSVTPGPDFDEDCAAAGGVPYGPTIDTLGVVTCTGSAAVGVSLKWTDTTGTSSPVTVFKVDGTPVTVLVTEHPTLGDVEAIATGFVESTVNEVASKRFCKKQQMQWSKEGAHLLLQTRLRVLNGELAGIFKRWYPDMDLEVEEIPIAA